MALRQGERTQIRPLSFLQSSLDRLQQARPHTGIIFSCLTKPKKERKGGKNKKISGDVPPHASASLEDSRFSQNRRSSLCNVPWTHYDIRLLQYVVERWQDYAKAEIGEAEHPTTFACTRFAVHLSKPHVVEAWLHKKHAGEISAHRSPANAYPSG